MTEFKYSIIIPHKNIPNLLQRCLDSIPRREDIQIIVIDDNSDSMKVDFSHFPGMGTSYIEVYLTKEGKGAGYARNVGLEHAKGKWIFFVDADDFLATDFLKKVDQFASSDNDIIFFRLVDEKYLPSIPVDLRDIIDIRRANDYNKLLKRDNHFLALEHYVPVGKMINRHCVEVNRIHFDEIPCANDVMFFTKLAFCIKKVEISDEYLYCISKPTMHNLTSRKDYHSGKFRLQVLLARNQILQEHGFYNMVTSPLIIIWQFRQLGFVSILSYCWIVIKSTTPLLKGFSKFLRKPFAYLKTNK